MPSNRFAFLARLLLLCASVAMAILSLTTDDTFQEFAYGAGSIIAAVLLTFVQRREDPKHIRTTRHQP